MRFIVPSRDNLPAGALDRAYMCGLEGIPWRARTHWQPASLNSSGEFVLERAVSESGNLFVPWHCGDSREEVVLSTASLMERPAPYHLTIEVARGLLNQVRTQSSDWQLLGLQLPPQLTDLLKEAAGCFGGAVTETDRQQAGACAERTIELAARAAEMLMDEYARQALDVRHQQVSQLPTMLGAALGSEVVAGGPTAEPLAKAINSAAIDLRWSAIEATPCEREWEAYDRQLEWCQQAGLRIMGGPLLHLRSCSVPPWLGACQGDFEKIQSHLNQHVESVVTRYRGRVQIWNCAAGMNVRSDYPLDEENKLRLVVSAIEQIRKHDENTPLVISFDQPWGEYLAFEEVDLSPLHFADSLVRAELGVAGIGLEINLGYWPGGTLPRNRLEFSRLLDRWSMLNLPLIVFLTIPTECPSAAGESGRSSRQPAPTCSGCSPSRQAELAAQLLPVLMAKSFVQGIIWNQLSDATRPFFTGSGLFDAELKAKPTLAVLEELRVAHLM